MAPPLRDVAPPPPPKGWQSRHSALVTFAVRHDEDGRPHHAYRIAGNFGSSEEARTAAIDLCAPLIHIPVRSEDLPQNRRWRCASGVRPLPLAFYALILERDGRVAAANDNRYAHARYNNGNALKDGERIRACADVSLGLQACSGVVLGMGGNGIFTRATGEAPFDIAPCGSGAARPGHAVIGVDRASGESQPLCGPDPDAYLAAERRGLHEGVAMHPRHIDFWAVGGFRDAQLAQAEAIRLCDRRTGGGCVGMGTATDGVVAVLRADGGHLVMATGRTVERAIEAGRRRCDAGRLLPCTLVATRATGDPAPRIPAGEPQSYGAVAVHDGVGGARLWVARDHPTRDAAEGAALAACRSAEPPGTSCRVAASTLGGAIFAVSTPDGRVAVAAVQKGAMDDDGTHRYDRIVTALCATLGRGCVSRGSFSPGSGTGVAPRTSPW